MNASCETEVASVVSTTSGPITRIDVNGFRATPAAIADATNTPAHAELGGGAPTYARENPIAAIDPRISATVMNGNSYGPRIGCMSPSRNAGYGSPQIAPSANHP